MGKGRQQVFESLTQVFSSHERVFQLWFGSRLTIGVTHPELIRKVLTNADCVEKPFFYRFSRVDHGLWAANANLWHQQRRAVNPTFSSRVLSSFVPMFENLSAVLVDRLSTRQGLEVDILQFSSQTALEMVCATTLGSRLDQLGTENSDLETLVDRLDRLSGIVSKRLFSPHLHSDIVYQRTSDFRKEMNLRYECYEVTSRILDRKRQNVHQKSPQAPKVFIEQLLDTSLVKRRFTDQEIIHNVYSMLAAGSETTALTLAYACLLLAMFQDVQETVFKEISEVLDPEDPLTVETLTRLRYMDQFFRETMRLCPVAPLIARETTSSIELDGARFPKGTVFLMSIFALHRRKDLWGPDSDKFNPDRFEEGNSLEGRDPFAYIPFSAGSRNCIGHRYANISMKIMIVYMLRKFRLNTSLRFEDLKFESGMMLFLAGQHLVRLETRETY
ncbi:probable cytochrome P450 313b1 [Uranotaenia lowii]|uniref:probable cytochrome P450 313b1 n=1 Tax=Uranotaenia lowii TaxID=190385 RepID=UPI00247A8052|nr:probable cytochrome P450 313b1 [Uranotaenia lowii]